MCYDISFRTQLEEITAYFPELVTDPQLKVEWPSYEHLQAQAYPKIPIIYRDKKDGVLRLKVMEWGIIRHTAEVEPPAEERRFNLNIMSEKIFNKHIYWNQIKDNRCLIPMNDTFEHRGIRGWSKKVPYVIRPKEMPGVFFMPGLYSVASIVDKNTGELVEKWTWGLITREPSPDNIIRQIHNDSARGFRMALYLPFNVAKEFVSQGLADDKYKKILNYEMKSDDLVYFPVDTIRTAKPRKDGKKKYEPYDWGGKVPELGTLNPTDQK